MNSKANPLANKMVKRGKQYFKLWLEFEETEPWDDLENNYANITVDTLDGRRYGLNVWTFPYLETALKTDRENGYNLSGLYQIPPDLLVKELTRDCIEKTIADLLKTGDLEVMLNRSVYGLNFIPPYTDVNDMESKTILTLLKEFRLELPDSHELFHEDVDLIARKNYNDDIVLRLEDNRIAVVHLTWKSQKEADGFPGTRIYRNEREFWEKEMKEDILEFRE